MARRPHQEHRKKTRPCVQTRLGRISHSAVTVVSPTVHVAEPCSPGLTESWVSRRSAVYSSSAVATNAHSVTRTRRRPQRPEETETGTSSGAVRGFVAGSVVDHGSPTQTVLSGPEIVEADLGLYLSVNPVPRARYGPATGSCSWSSAQHRPDHHGNHHGKPGKHNRRDDREPLHKTPVGRPASDHGPPSLRLSGRFRPPPKPTYADAIAASDDSSWRRWRDSLTFGPRDRDRVQ